ncbi:MAG: ankyrin repeat domain-containing protein [Oscillospiraceae bacterium]|nr:ankyrin repeat domain-containing protein [Oscillospiraceae bacterium]
MNKNVAGNPGNKRKRKTLPQNFKELLNAGDISVLKAVFDKCELNAYGGYGKGTALHFYGVPDELVRWLVERGADVNARDMYQNTPLHKCDNVELLLDLGADIEAVNYQDETPLHLACSHRNIRVVRLLLSRNANVNAKNKRGFTPLSLALAHCRNADITNCAKIAELMLDAKNPAIITPDMAESVMRIGRDFEFHREGFNKESLDETEKGLARLYELFKVAPAEKRRLHDGVSPIAVKSHRWQEQHQELWELLVPSQGAAKTVQGEVIRITGRVSIELLDNGAVNWDDDYRKMLDAFIKHIASGTQLLSDEFVEAGEIVKCLHSGNGGNGGNESVRLCELAVKWVLLNPEPISLGNVTYRR